MKTQFKTLTDFAAEIERREVVKEDVIVDTRQITLEPDNNTFIVGPQTLKANGHFHSQVQQRLSIPKDYYDRIGNVEGLRAYNVNSLLRANADKKPEKRLVRTLDGVARAYLSDRYAMIDNAFVLNAFLPALLSSPELKNVEVHASSLTDRRMYLQLSFPSIEGEVRPGDVIRAGIGLSNSEVGVGAYDVSEFELRLRCMNGATYQSLIRKSHVGRAIGDSDEDYQIYSDEAIQAELNAFRLRIRDTTLAYLAESAFNERLDRLRVAAGIEITKPVQTIEVVTKRFRLTQEEGQTVFENIEKEKDYTKYGLYNGITALARELDDRDRAYELEQLGGRIITLDKKDWKTIVDEAA